LDHQKWVGNSKILEVQFLEPTLQFSYSRELRKWKVKKISVSNLYLQLVLSSFNVRFDDVQLQMIIQEYPREYQTIFLYLGLGS